MYDEIWAVDVKRIRKYFQDTGQILGRDVEVYELPERPVGRYQFPQTRVVISGENADERHRKFVLNFISIGG